MKKVAITVFVGVLIGALSSCTNKKEQNKIKDKIEVAKDSIKEAWDDAKEDLKEGVEEVKEEVVKGYEDVKKKLD